MQGSKQRGPGGSATVYTHAALRLWNHMADGQDVAVVGFDADLAKLSMRPIVLDVVVTPLIGSQGTGDESSDDNGGLGFGGGGGLGGIGGGGGSAGPPEGAVQIDARWTYGDGTVVTAEPSGSLCTADATCMASQTIEIVLSAQGLPDRKLERTLIELPPGERTPPGHRRYVVEIVDRIATDDDAKAAMSALKARVDAAQPQLDAEAAVAGSDASQRDRLIALDVAAEAGHAIAMRFAATSDAATQAAAKELDVVVTRPAPRVLITSFEADGGGNTAVSFDLRLDEVEAEGAAAHDFQLGRGIAESRLEGLVLATLVGRPAITTSRVMEAAFASGTEVRVLAGRRAPLPDGMPEPAARRVRAALGAGRQVIVPSAAVDVDGVTVWGWWEVDVENGRTVGVMESGQHQAFAEYNTMLKEGGLNPDTGFMMGMLLGSNYAMFAIAGEILLHGQVTQQFLVDLEKELQQIACTMCPMVGGEIKIEQKVAGDCFKQNIKRYSPVDENFSFCERYNDGFKCAVGVFIHGLLGDIKAYTVEASAKLKYGCAELGGDTGGVE